MASTAMGSYSTILTTLHKHFIFLFRPFMNLLQDGFCSHGIIFHYSDHPSSTQCLWICSWTALTARGSYSTILTTLQKPITFLWKSFMNLLLDGFSSHGLIFHDSDHPSETFHFPIQTLHKFAPGWLLHSCFRVDSCITTRGVVIHEDDRKAFCRRIDSDLRRGYLAKFGQLTELKKLLFETP